MKRLRTAVIGAGHLGKAHARIYHDLEGGDLVTICDTDPEKAERAKAYGASFTTNFREALRTVDLASIVTPTSTHFEIAKEALLAGVHVLIEKPITNSLEQADELMNLARERKLTLQVGHLERHNAGYRRIEKLARNIRFIEIHRLGPFHPRIKDCGVVLDLMIHDFDLVLQLVKSEIESIDAIGINVLTPFEDIANVRIKFKNKTIADVTASRLTPEAQRKIRIFQDDAYISLDFVAQSAQIFRKAGLASLGGPAFGGPFGWPGTITREKIDIQKEEPLRVELEQFVHLVRSGAANGKPDVAAREALHVALQVLESIKENAPEPTYASSH